MLGNINKYIIFFLLCSFFSHAIAKEKKWMSLNNSDPEPALSKCYSEAENLIRDGKKVNGIKNQKDFDVYITVCMADQGFFAL
jgi:hypothetical protein